MDLDDEELKATRRMNGSDKNVGSIEEKMKVYIQTYNGLKRNKDIVKSIDKEYFFELVDYLIKAYKELEKENKRLKGKIDVCDWQEKSCREIIDEKYILVSLVKEKIEEYEEKAKRIAGTYQYADSYEDLENKKNQVIKLRTKAESLKELLKGE